MLFTALHQALGQAPGPVTEAMLEDAISAGLLESGGLDWKERLPPIKALASTDVPRDIAGMANAGGGVIIYGVNEENKAATSRSDKVTYGEATAERYERAYKSVAVSAIHPPVFGVELVEISASPLAVAAIIPASVDGPHLIYSNDFFGPRCATEPTPSGCAKATSLACTVPASTNNATLTKPPNSSTRTRRAQRTANACGLWGLRGLGCGM